MNHFLAKFRYWIESKRVSKTPNLKWPWDPQSLSDHQILLDHQRQYFHLKILLDQTSWEHPENIMEKSWWNTMRASREHLENIHILPGCSKRLTSGSCGAAQSPISQQECRSRNKQTVDDARSWSFLLALLFSSTQLENKSWKILGSFCGGIGETVLPLSSGWSYQEMIYFNNKTNIFFSIKRFLQQ